MGAYDGLVGEHEAMGPLIASFRAALADRPADLGEVAALRWAVIRSLMDHFTREEVDLCGPLVATGNASAIAATMGFREVHGSVRAEMMAYQDDWPTGRMGREWDAFCRASEAVLAKVQDRMAIEETQLYPEAARLLGSGAPS